MPLNTNNSTYHFSSICTQLNGFKPTKWSNSSIWLADGILTGITNPGQSNGNEEILHSKSSRTGASLSDCSVSYPLLLWFRRGGALTFLQRYSQCILRPQLTGLWQTGIKCILDSKKHKKASMMTELDKMHTWLKLTYWFQWHVNASRVILCLEVRELHTYLHFV